MYVFTFFEVKRSLFRQSEPNIPILDQLGSIWPVYIKNGSDKYFQNCLKSTHFLWTINIRNTYLLAIKVDPKSISIIKGALLIANVLYGRPLCQRDPSIIFSTASSGGAAVCKNLVLFTSIIPFLNFRSLKLMFAFFFQCLI